MADIRTPRAPLSRPRRARGWLCACLVACGMLAPAAAADAAASQLPSASTDDDAIAARAVDGVLRWKELDALLIARHAMSREGRAALRHLAESRLLEVLEKEGGVVVPEKTVLARRNDLDTQIRGSGDTDGIAGHLRKARLSEPEFLRFLRLSFVQETLTRRALGLGDEAQLNADQQQIWIDEELRARGYVELTPPWKDGVVARGVGFAIDRNEFARYLRSRLPVESIEDDCFQLLLYRRMLARMPDLAQEKLDLYVEKEIDRRRSDANADPRYKGIPFEKLIASQGLALESLPKDPAVLVAALSRLWVDRSYPDEALRRVYSSERELFDGLYGEAIDTSMLFLRAAQFKNDLNPRAFAEAEAQLSESAARIASKDDLLRLAKEISEDAASREKSGALGWLTAKTPRLPVEIQAEVEKRLGSPTADARPLVGPLRLANGCVLLWFGTRRPAPSWEAMSAHVQRELRKRFIDEVLPRASLVTGFDTQ